jgi:predicted ATP-grasp superfamily ATP-dependent carboligase
MRLSDKLQTRVAIVGGSTRAAAFSAIRAGFQPFCWDQFADADLEAVADVQRCDLRDRTIAWSAADMPLIYCGGLENHPEWLAEAEKAGRIWGNPASVVREIRQPYILAEKMRELRLPTLELHTSSSPPRPDGEWLLKPIQSGGGRGIAIWDDEAREHPTLATPHVFQKRAHGLPYSAVFLGTGAPGDVNFVGITRQLVGLESLNAGPFLWCGNVGPVSLPLGTEHLIRRIGNILNWKFQLAGLFGCDFVIDEEGVPWLTEVNPRYPASAEVFELACGFRLLQGHAAAFGITIEGGVFDFEISSQGMIGKGVLYADRDLIMPAIDRDQWATPGESIGRIADVTPAGVAVRAGQPVCTFLVEGESEEDVLAALESAARALRTG